MNNKVITRFAPSPTGYIHVGGIRTALFAWLLARQNNGKFILRLEDTDQAREVKGADEHIMSSLKALGLNYDAGPDIPDEFGPYRQSDRLIIYSEWAKKLIEQGRAYADPYTKKELEGFREQAKIAKKPFLYRNHRPENPPIWDGTQPLRLKSNPKAYDWHDEVMGDLSAGPEAIDDFVIVKADGFPTYNFAHIIDDYLMNVTHVIRGQEFISSMPNYFNLYEALGFEEPKFATMPHILGPSGSKKLSKRDGAKDVLDYLKDGYLEDALVNFIASLGWNDGTEQEVFRRQELIDKFSLSHVQKSPARFDEKRLLWLNGQWVRELSLDDLASRVNKLWPAEADNYDDAYRLKVLELAQARLKTLNDLPVLTSFFFAEPKPDLELLSSNKQLAKLNNDEKAEILKKASQAFESSEFDPESIQQTLNDLLQTEDLKPAVLFSLIRIATTWAPFSPDLAPSLSLLGKERTTSRILVATDLLATT